MSNKFINEEGDLSEDFNNLLEDLFRRFDVDGDGLLNNVELQEFAKTCNNGRDFSEKELDEIKTCLECDDGRLKLRGFKEMFHIQTVSDHSETVKDLAKLGYGSDLQPLGEKKSSVPETPPVEVEQIPMMVESPSMALANLITWVNKRGGIVSGDVQVAGVGKGGRGLIASTNLKAKGGKDGKDCVLSLPENVLMSRRTACLYGGLHKVLESRTEMPDDEVLALFLMLEKCRAEMTVLPRVPEPETPESSAPKKKKAHKKKNNVSKKKLKGPPPVKEAPPAPVKRVIPVNALKGKGQWAHYVRSLPDRIDSPLFWNDNDLNLLQGTTVFDLTMMMRKQITKDFQTIIFPLVHSHPDVFGNYMEGMTLKKYSWALTIVYSRAIGLWNQSKYIRVLAPVLDMANHKEMGEVNVVEDSKPVSKRLGMEDFVRFDSESKSLQLSVPFDIAKDEEVCISYGDYSNAKLLFTYGFVVPHNEPRGLDFWLRCPKDDPLLVQKSNILKSHPMTANQSYDFKGTLRRDKISLAFLATVRITKLKSIEELTDLAPKALSPKPLNKENELDCYQTIIASCKQKLDYCDKLRQQRKKNNGKCNKEKLGAAFRIHHEDEIVLQDTIDTVEKWVAGLAADEENFTPTVF